MSLLSTKTIQIVSLYNQYYSIVHEENVSLVHERKKLTTEATIETNVPQSSRFDEESDDEMLDPNIEILTFKTVEFELVQNENNEIVGLETREFDDSNEETIDSSSFHKPNIQMVLENRLEAECKAKAEEKARLEAELEKEARLEAEAKVKAETKVKAEAEKKAGIKAEEQTRLKTEEKAKIKAVAETKAKTRAEEQAGLEAEAKLKAEEKARLEDEAKAKKEEKVRLEAEAEEKLRLEAEAKAELEEKAKLEVRGFHGEKARLQKEAESKGEAEENAKLEEHVRLKAEANALLSKFKCSYCKEDFSSNSDLSHHMLLPPCVYLQDEAGPPGALFGIVEDESVFTGNF